MKQTEIEIVKGDLLVNTEGFIIHSCNAQGIMGSGVAAGIKKVFPNAFNVYHDQYMYGKPELGSLTISHEKENLYVINLIGQQTFGSGLQTSYEALRIGFADAAILMDQIDPEQKLPLLLPKIGAGRGGGDWDKIKIIIQNTFFFDRRVIVFLVDEEPKY